MHALLQVVHTSVEASEIVPTKTSFIVIVEAFFVQGCTSPFMLQPFPTKWPQLGEWNGRSLKLQSHEVEPRKVAAFLSWNTSTTICRIRLPNHLRPPFQFDGHCDSTEESAAPIMLLCSLHMHR